MYCQKKPERNRGLATSVHCRVWSPVRHLQSVLDAPDWREAYNASLPLLTQHSTEISQNKKLQQAFERVSDSLPDNASEAQRTLVEHALRDFRLAGVALPDEKKAEFRDLMQELATVQANFDQNVQDSTDSWHHHTEDEAKVSQVIFFFHVRHEYSL